MLNELKIPDVHTWKYVETIQKLLKLCVVMNKGMSQVRSQSSELVSRSERAIKSWYVLRDGYWFQDA